MENVGGEGVGNADADRAEEDKAIAMKMAGIEEVDYKEYVLGVQKVMTFCMGDALAVIQEGLDESREGLNESTAFGNSIEAEDTLKFWDTMRHMIKNVLPISIMRTKEPLGVVQRYDEIMSNIRTWMRKTSEEEHKKAKFYRKSFPEDGRDMHMYFWDPTGERHPVDLWNEYMGQQQAKQMPQGQPPPVVPDDPMIM